MCWQYQMHVVFTLNSAHYIKVLVLYIFLVFACIVMEIVKKNTIEQLAMQWAYMGS